MSKTEEFWEVSNGKGNLKKLLFWLQRNLNFLPWGTCSSKLNKWALKFEIRKSEKILPRDLSNDDILKILDIYLEN